MVIVALREKACSRFWTKVWIWAAVTSPTVAMRAASCSVPWTIEQHIGAVAEIEHAEQDHAQHRQDQRELDDRRALRVAAKRAQGEQPASLGQPQGADLASDLLESRDQRVAVGDGRRLVGVARALRQVGATGWCRARSPRSRCSSS